VEQQNEEEKNVMAAFEDLMTEEEREVWNSSDSLSWCCVWCGALQLVFEK
jgi:hypothetical protein